MCTPSRRCQQLPPFAGELTPPRRDIGNPQSATPHHPGHPELLSFTPDTSILGARNEQNRGHGTHPSADPLREFLRAETAGGIVLPGATIIALAWATSPVSGSYSRLWATELSLGTSPARHPRGPAAPGQRGLDGGVLLRRWPGDQARAGDRCAT